jgi:hypothetical protein
LVDVVVKTSVAYRLTEGVKVPAAVQLPFDVQLTLVKFAIGVEYSTPLANEIVAGTPHVPLMDVIAKALRPSAVFLYEPTAVQLPADEHETATRVETGVACCMPSGKTTGCA